MQNEEIIELIREELKNIIREVLDEYIEDLQVQKDSEAEEYMRVEEVADYTTLSISNIYQKAALPLDEGGIPSIKIGTVRVFVKSEVEKWLKSDFNREEDYSKFLDD